MNDLSAKLTAALKSREQRLIRRRLPDPSTSEPSSPLVDFNSNDYLSLSRSPELRRLFLSKLHKAPEVLGSGGSRLLVNGHAHNDLETRLAKFFDAPSALLFNSGFDANVGLFSCVPQPGDIIVYDEYIHASVHDGIRASRVRAYYPFTHNSVSAFREVLQNLLDAYPEIETRSANVFVAMESLYSMDGTFAPIREVVEIVEAMLPKRNGYVIVDEAHATGIYGPNGRGMVAMLGLEKRVFARLHTFGKALAGTGAVVLTNSLVRDYMLNYARSLIYTTSLSFANIISVDCSFDLLENGHAHMLAVKLLDLSAYLLATLRPRLNSIPQELLTLPPYLLDQQTRQNLPPSPIIPIMTIHPRALSNFLFQRGVNARPITWPTVPKGKDRVRVCLHAGNSRENIDKLVDGMMEWAQRAVEETRKELTDVRIESKL